MGKDFIWAVQVTRSGIPMAARFIVKPMKPKTLHLKCIPGPMQEQALLMAGYERHHKNDSFIKELYNEKRFHAYVHDGSIEIHIDRTVNNFHQVAPWMNMLSIEAKRIKKIYREKYPKPKKIKVKRMKDAYAPNLMELQRSASKLNT